MTITDAETGLTAERLRYLLDYDPITGIFRWRVSTSNRAPVGSIAGRKSKAGYWRIGIDGERYYGHCLAWLYVHGEWPPDDLDHEDTIKWHNWIDNLRPADKSKNGANRSSTRLNTSGFKGVTAHQGRWRATVKKNYLRFDLGCFDTPEEAHAAYVAKAKELFGEFANAG